MFKVTRIFLADLWALTKPYWFSEERWAARGLLAVVVAAGAVWGDLLESLIKREFGVKDAGAWLPGFGGLLDRADSLVVTAPLLYHLLHAFAG